MSSNLANTSDRYADHGLLKAYGIQEYDWNKQSADQKKQVLTNITKRYVEWSNLPPRTQLIAYSPSDFWLAGYPISTWYDI